MSDIVAIDTWEKPHYVWCNELSNGEIDARYVAPARILLDAAFPGKLNWGKTNYDQNIGFSINNGHKGDTWKTKAFYIRYCDKRGMKAPGTYNPDIDNGIIVEVWAITKDGIDGLIETVNKWAEKYGGLGNKEK